MNPMNVLGGILRKGPKCFVCGKTCDETDRNNDGSYAHRNCLITTSSRPRPRA